MDNKMKNCPYLNCIRVYYTTMFSLIALIGILAYVQLCVHCYHLPNYIQPCSKSDPKFEDCVIEHAIASYGKVSEGDRKYKLSSLRPLQLPLVEVDAGSNLKLTFKNLEVWGLDTLKITDLKIDLQNKKYSLKGIIPNLYMKGGYEVNGKILVLPIQGEGASNLTFVNGVYDYSFNWEIINKNGKEFMEIHNPNLEMKLERAQFYLDNLFNGDKTLGDNMNTLLNENWGDVIAEIGPGMRRTIAVVITNIHSKFFEAIPYDEIFTN